VDSHILIPITLFACLTYAFVYLVKAVVDARMRSLLARSGASEELLRSILAGEEQQRRFNSLRWGVSLVAVALGFGVIQMFGPSSELTPGAIAVLAGAVGAGQLAFFAISAKFNPGNQMRV